MNKTILLFLIVTACSACNRNNHFRITGELPNTSYDGEWIYLVPLVNAPVERVDSTIIKNGKFSFEGEVEIPEIYVIRGRPYIRLSLQELLVVKEPGIIKANLDHNSSAGGTALNDSLEYWKNYKSYTDTLLVNLKTQYKATSDTLQQMPVKQKADSIKKEITNFNYHFIINNKSNVVGELVYRLQKGSFSPEQIKTLGLEE